MRSVQKPIADGVRLVRIPYEPVPVLHGKLTRDERGPTLGTILDHFHEVSPFGFLQRM